MQISSQKSSCYRRHSLTDMHHALWDFLVKKCHIQIRISAYKTGLDGFPVC